MYHRKVIAEVARRLPHQTRRDVYEVVDLLTEIWSAELLRGEQVVVPGIGRLSLEVQSMRAGGALIQHGQLSRVYGRFRLTPQLKQRMKELEFE